MKTNLAEIISELHVLQVTGRAELVEVSNVTLDSRAVTNGSVFVAIRGYKTDGHKFIQAAVSNGASAIILDDQNAVPDQLFSSNKIVKILVKDSRVALAEFSKIMYDDPSSKLKLIGITGTKGKTTTAFYVKNILEAAGHKVGLFGTIANYIGSEEIPTKLTTPESHVINELLAGMVAKGCEYCVMEVSSHSLELQRVAGLKFEVIAFTNITSDHLDFHENFENYLNAKKILFDNAGKNTIAVVNADDNSWQKISKSFKGTLITFGKQNYADYKLESVDFSLNGTTYEITGRGNTYQLSTGLIGGFNAYNSGIAFTVCHQAGINSEMIQKGISEIPQVPGRFEVLHGKAKKVIVDYSHTTDSLLKALEAIRIVAKQENKIITVMGCGGDRDKTKRPEMGKVASDLSDLVYVTSDNPRTEDPFLIIKDIEQGLTKNNYKKIENRGEAIKAAITEAPAESVILIAGKGHEEYQEINGIRHHFSDKEEALRYLETENLTITIEDLFELTDAVIYEPDTFIDAATVVIDSRIAKQDQIFLAMKGERIDSHDFVNNVAAKGIRGVIIDEDQLGRYDDLGITIVTVKDTLKAYAELAAIYRKKLKAKVVSITGSNGKTSTKEILAEMLSVKYKVHKTEANNNNHIGVPKTIFECPEETDVLILEHGTNHFGEIEFTAKVANADYSLITNIGESHIEFLENREGVLKEKIALFENTLENKGTIFVNSDDELLIEATAEFDNKITFGFSGNCEVCGEDLGLRPDGKPRIGIKYDDVNIITGMPVYGTANVKNVLASAAVCRSLGLNENEIEKGIASLKAIKGRLDVKHLNNFTLIDDTYNANPVSVKAAIDVLAQFAVKGKRVAFLGDMFELGDDSEKYHAEIGEYIKKSKTDMAVFVGKLMEKAFLAADDGLEAYHFEKFDNVENFLKSFNPENSAILVKGSRGMKMERIIKILSDRNE